MLMVWFAEQQRNISFIKPNGIINAINMSFEERFFTKGIFLRLWFLDQNNCFIASKQPLKYQPSIIFHSWVRALWRFLVCLHFFAKSSIKKREIKNKTHLCNIVGYKNSEAAHHRYCYIRAFSKICCKFTGEHLYRRVISEKLQSNVLLYCFWKTDFTGLLLLKEMELERETFRIY